MSSERVVIVGGGPAGSILGSYLSIAGVPNVLLEGAVHPRPHVGESLVASTTRVFREIGFLETMERGGFVRKYGATWHPPAGAPGRSSSILFGEIRQPGIDQDYTYHVDRGRFDLALLKHAEGLGTRVCQGVRARKVLFRDGRACGVLADLAGTLVELPASLVVDASGRSALLGRQLRLLRPDPEFDQFAVHAWFENVDRGPASVADHIHIYFLPIRRGWVWQIPIDASITSVGIVAERSEFVKAGGSVEEWFLKGLAASPGIARAMAGARRINELKREADYSYCVDRFVGDGFLLVGDAARFVDPIFSSGVSVAAEGARFASGVVRDALAAGDVSRERLLPYERHLRSGVDVWYEFITLYYQLLPLFTYFIEHKEHRLEILRLLQGEVYDRDEVRVLAEMRSFIAEVKANGDNLLAGSLEARPEVVWHEEAS